MVKPAAATIGLHQADVIFVGELINAIKEFLTISRSPTTIKISSSERAGKQRSW